MNIFDFEKAANFIAPEGYKIEDGSRLQLTRGLNGEIIIDYDGVLKKEEKPNGYGQILQPIPGTQKIIKDRNASVYRRLLGDMKNLLDNCRQQKEQLKKQLQEAKETCLIAAAERDEKISDMQKVINWLNSENKKQKIELYNAIRLLTRYGDIDPEVKEYLTVIER